MGKFFRFELLRKYGNKLGLDPKRWHAYADAPGANAEKRFIQLNMADYLLDAYEFGEIGLYEMLAAAAKKLPMGRTPTLFEFLARASVEIGLKKRSRGGPEMPPGIVRLARFLAQEIENNPSRRMPSRRMGKRNKGPLKETLAEAVQREMEELGLKPFVKSIETLEGKLTGIAKRPGKKQF